MKNITLLFLVLGLLGGCEADTPTAGSETVLQVVEDNPAEEGGDNPSDASAGDSESGGQDATDDNTGDQSDAGSSAEDTAESTVDTEATSEDVVTPECTGADNCNDLDPCTSDECVDGSCVNEAIEACCTLDEQCDDGIDCTEDSCNAFTNACTHTPEDNFCCVSQADCDDFKPCTADLCLNNQCVAVWESGEGCNCLADIMCDDNNPCTAETCAGGACVYTAVSGNGCCEDGNCPQEAGSASLCIYNQCWSDETVCESAEDCVPPTTCWESQCTESGCEYTEKEACCQMDMDCDDGQEATVDSCVDNTCVYAAGESIPCVLDVDCLTDNPCTAGVCTEAGVCSITVKESEGCCSESAECAQPDDPCLENVCEAFNCVEQSFTGVLPAVEFNFNDGTLEGWTEESNGAGAYWHLSGFQSPDGEFALYFGQDTSIDYNVGIAQGSVQSPPYSALSGKIGVQFDRIAHVEPISSRDLFWLELLQGSEATEVWNKNDNNGPGLGWKTEVVDITEVASDKEFRLRFKFDSVDAQSNEYEGLYVDNVLVGTLCQ